MNPSALENHLATEPYPITPPRGDYIADALLDGAQWSGQMPYERECRISGYLKELQATLPVASVIRLSRRGPKFEQLVVEVAGCLVLVETWTRGRATIRVVGTEMDMVDAVLAEIRDKAQAAVVPMKDKVSIKFWAMDASGSSFGSSRPIDAPAWDPISNGYGAGTRQALTALMGAEQETLRAGRLVLWHGEPGTGKTTAVRSLAREWSEWCDTHYVTDPERLFGSPDYLLDVCGGNEDEENGRWRVIVAEDCDEYLRADARKRAGASLGRLLNLADGILGHGLRSILLLTTNEDLGRLHPAVTRPGRCLATICFDRLTRIEADSWLGSAVPGNGTDFTLAELYALRERGTVPAQADGTGLGGYL